jgi:hypothetical protein
MIPGLLTGFRARIEALVKPTAEDLASIERAEMITSVEIERPVPAPNQRETQRLQVVA